MEHSSVILGLTKRFCDGFHAIRHFLSLLPLYSLGVQSKTIAGISFQQFSTYLQFCYRIPHGSLCSFRVLNIPHMRLPIYWNRFPFHIRPIGRTICVALGGFNLVTSHFEFPFEREGVVTFELYAAGGWLFIIGWWHFNVHVNISIMCRKGWVTNFCHPPFRSISDKITTLLRHFSCSNPPSLTVIIESHK